MPESYADSRPPRPVETSELTESAVQRRTMVVLVIMQVIGTVAVGVAPLSVCS